MFFFKGNQFFKAFITLCGFTVSKTFKGNQIPQLYVLPYRMDVLGVHYIVSYVHTYKTKIKNQTNLKIILFFSSMNIYNGNLVQIF